MGGHSTVVAANAAGCGTCGLILARRPDTTTDDVTWHAYATAHATGHQIATWMTTIARQQLFGGIS